MSNFRAFITDHGFPNLQQEEAVFKAAGIELIVVQAKTAEAVIAAAKDADALLVQWAPINAGVIAALTRCNLIVRYGIGVDNVDLTAAKARGIPVCNVPDYGVNEVAEHAVSLALALARQLPQIDARLRSGTWKITPDRPMASLREMTFATAGFGRIARAAHAMMRGFNGNRIAYDPFVPAAAMAAEGVEKVEVDELFSRSDILSLHLPLTPTTQHFVNGARLAQMKPTTIVINTARGPLIDTVALKSGADEWYARRCRLGCLRARASAHGPPDSHCATRFAHVACGVVQRKQYPTLAAARGRGGRPRAPRRTAQKSRQSLSHSEASFGYHQTERPPTVSGNIHVNDIWLQDSSESRATRTPLTRHAFLPHR